MLFLFISFLSSRADMAAGLLATIDRIPGPGLLSTINRIPAVRLVADATDGMGTYC